MKYLLILVAILFASCAEVPQPSQKSRQVAGLHPLRVRVTFYGGARERVACPRIRFAQQGLSVAAHPKYPFGTKFIIPQLKPYLGNDTFIVHDRGSAVTSRRASHGRADVIDVFVNSMTTLRKFERDLPEYMEAIRL